MSETISVSVTPEIKTELDALAEQNGVARSDLIRTALQDYLFFHRSRALRERMVAEAQAQGIFTDEDVFE